MKCQLNYLFLLKINCLAEQIYNITNALIIILVSLSLNF